VDIPTPSEVKLGVFMWTQKLLALRDKGVGGLTGIKTGDLQVNYSVTLIESDPELYAQFVGWRLIPGL
jgi:DnaJ-class molecular chaperone